MTKPINMESALSFASDWAAESTSEIGNMARALIRLHKAVSGAASATSAMAVVLSAADIDAPVEALNAMNEELRAALAGK